MRAMPIVVILAVLSAGPVLAQQYRWIDEKGRVQYSDTPPPPAAKSVRRLSGPVEGASGAPKPVPGASPEIARLIEQSPVILYSHPGCTDSCQLARDVLNRRGVPFREVQVVTTKDIEELKARSGETNVPVLVVGERVTKVPSEAAFDAALDAGGYPKVGVLPARTQAAPAAPKPEEMQTVAGDQKPPAPAPAAAPEAPRGPYAPSASSSAPGASKPAAKPAAKAP